MFTYVYHRWIQIATLEIRLYNLRMVFVVPLLVQIGVG